ncbi:hypothetical protein ACFSVK_14880 [Azorhizophilus paspali]|uniref:hypothetical protein n=1 Tax=Azorhizophilus paspali TaxID=69963 RepID=UPI00363962B4
MIAPVREGQVVGHELGETVPATDADHHRGFAAAQAQGAASRPLLEQPPAGRIGVAEAGESGTGLEAREARCLSDLYPPKERLKGPVQPPQGFLQGVTAQLHQLRAQLLDGG